jgi:3-hydroxybutyryl-CoA dehydrogenase
VTDSQLRNISIFGSGLMGSGIALLFSLNGFKTTVYAIEESESQVKEKIKKNLLYLQEKGVVSQSSIPMSLNMLTVTDDMGSATEKADFIIECVPEDMTLKQNLFKQLDSITNPKVILATNTSVMSITEIASKSKNRNRIVGTHFWNPPYLIPLVEVIKTEDTSESVMEQTLSLLESVGKRPVRVNRDVPGFVANRLQHALWREAISIVENGIADAETVDTAIKNSFGLRLPVLGPIENADMVGNDLTLSIHEYMLEYLENSPKPSSVLQEKVSNQQLGFKSKQGFYTWDEMKIKDTQNRMLDHLIAITKNNNQALQNIK